MNCMLLGHQLPADEKSEAEVHFRTCSSRITLVRQGAGRGRRLHIALTETRSSF